MPEINIPSSSNLTKMLLATTLGIVGLIGVEKFTRDSGTGCEVYQGYHVNKAEGNVSYVFDQKKLNARLNRAPNYILEGNSTFIDSLEIGKSYCFSTEKSIFPFYLKKMTSVTSNDSDI